MVAIADLKRPATFHDRPWPRATGIVPVPERGHGHVVYLAHGRGHGHGHVTVLSFTS